MTLHLTEDIRSVTDLKKNTREILDQLHHTGRPVILTVNGKADAVLMDAATYQKHLEAFDLAKALQISQDEVRAGKTRPIRTFLKEFKNARKISR